MQIPPLQFNLSEHSNHCFSLIKCLIGCMRLVSDFRGEITDSEGKSQFEYSGGEEILLSNNYKTKFKCYKITFY